MTLFIIICLLLISFFFGDLIFIVMLLISGGGFLLAYKYPDRYKAKLKNYLPNIFAVFFSFFIVVVLIEAYLHLLKPSFLNLSSSVVGELSDFKARGVLPENAFNKPEGTFRILGLGDSFAVSDYLDQRNYHNFLSAELKAAGAAPSEIVNAGIAGTGPGYYWHVLKNFGDLWKPDLVLVGFFVGNDFEEMDFEYFHRGPLIKEPTDPLRRWLAYLRFRGFWLYQYSRKRMISIWDDHRKKKEVKEGLVSRAGGFSRQSFLRVERERLAFFEKDKQADLDAVWRKKGNIFLKFKEWCSQRRIPLVIALFPDQLQVDRELRKEIFQTYHLTADAVDLAYPNRLLLDYCRQHDIHCVDMLPRFQEEGESRELYKPRDTHWNEAGNRLAGEVIYKYLDGHGLIPGAKEAGTHASPRAGNL
jgi:hypothetical protein